MNKLVAIGALALWGVSSVLAPAYASSITYSYDALGRLTLGTHASGTNPAVDVKYVYDAASNRTQMVPSKRYILGPGVGLYYIYGFQSGVDHVDLRTFGFSIDGNYMLTYGAVNVDNPGTVNDYCYFYLTNAGGVDNYVIFMGLLSTQLQGNDFVT